jgi:hypothetical protein
MGKIVDVAGSAAQSNPGEALDVERLHVRRSEQLVVQSKSSRQRSSRASSMATVAEQ